MQSSRIWCIIAGSGRRGGIAYTSNLSKISGVYDILEVGNFLKRRIVSRVLDKICAVSGCERPTYYPVCQYHTNRIRRGWLPEQHGIKHNPKCRVDTCDSPSVTLKDPYCRNHSDKVREGRSLETIRGKKKSEKPYSKARGRKCEHPGCGKEVLSAGLCTTHYHRRRNPLTSKTCVAEGCNRKFRPKTAPEGETRCKTHREQFRIYGETWTGERPYHLTQEYRDSLKVKCLVPHCTRKQASLNTPLCDTHRQASREMAGSEELYLKLIRVKECQICGDGTGKLVTDHDHSCCGKGRACEKCIRGRICNNCNSTLGYARDRKDVLESAIRYLNDWDSRKR